MQRKDEVLGAREDPVSEQLALFASDFESKILRPVREKREAGDEVLAIQPVALGVSEVYAFASLSDLVTRSCCGGRQPKIRRLWRLLLLCPTAVYCKVYVRCPPATPGVSCRSTASL